MNSVNPFSLAGKVALVTGANTGLGQGVAIALAQAGADIVAVGRSSMAETQRAVVAAGRSLHAVKADLQRSDDASRIVAEAVSAAGRVDILVNNAGIIRRADALEFTVEDWDDALDVNLKTPFFLAQAAARVMLHCARLELPGIADQKPLTLAAPVPSDMRELFAALGGDVESLLEPNWAT